MIEAPKPVETPDFGPVLALAKEMVAAVETDVARPKDIEHWMYEAVMEAVYGKGVWAYITQSREVASETHARVGGCTAAYAPGQQRAKRGERPTCDLCRKLAVVRMLDDPQEAP